MTRYDRTITIACLALFLAVACWLNVPSINDPMPKLKDFAVGRK